VTASALVHGDAPGRSPHGPRPAPPRTVTPHEVLELLQAALGKLDDMQAELADTRALLGQVDARCARLEAAARQPTPQPPPARPAPAGPGPVVPPAEGAEVATDAELDGPRGDEVIRYDPPRWPGESYAGCRLSECSPDYLETLASFNDWRARHPKPGQDPKWARLDARLARGWAARIRARGAEAPAQAETFTEEFGEIPF
jgi:hypothetical protein